MLETGGQGKAESPCEEGGRAGAIAAGSRALETKSTIVSSG